MILQNVWRTASRLTVKREMSSTLEQSYLEADKGVNVFTAMVINTAIVRPKKKF